MTVTRRPLGRRVLIHLGLLPFLIFALFPFYHMTVTSLKQDRELYDRFAVPLVISDKGVLVQDGIVEARPPGGVIRYRPPPAAGQTVASTNPHMEMVLQALSDFHYNVLAMSVQYQEDGNLLLNTRLEGNNPGWQKGRPVHFNLNVQENIPALLKSLEAVKQAEESVRRELGGDDDNRGGSDGGGP